MAVSERPPVQASESLPVPRPASDPGAPRGAPARTTPSRLRGSDRRLVEAGTDAQTGQAPGPPWQFRPSRARSAEIRGRPDAARGHEELLSAVEQGRPDSRQAVAEVSRVPARADERLGE
ncbi:MULTISPECIES: hypothetical protein [unclassified Nocardiopsis]|uniref:hypothetical protein n=1 Tax=unclassified Nocardiopsis TaxID=2649073 RepID=UPI00135CF450|nr:MULTISPECIES: hypothetical protein [unclassified Nocardiopsis]